MEYEIEAEFMLNSCVAGHVDSRTRPSSGLDSTQRPALHREQRRVPSRRRHLDGCGGRIRQLRLGHDQVHSRVGTFTDRQRAVYNAVLSVMQDAMKLLRLACLFTSTTEWGT